MHTFGTRFRNSPLMYGVVFGTFLTLSACSNSMTIAIPESGDPAPTEGMELRLFNLRSNPSHLVQTWTKPVCKFDFTITVDEVNAEDEDEPYVEVAFSNQLGQERFALQFYWANDAQEIWSLTEHSDDDSSMKTDVDFAIGETHWVSTSFERNSASLIIHPYADILKLIDGGHDGFSTTFEIHDYEVGFLPDRVSITAQSIDALLYGMTFKECDNDT